MWLTLSQELGLPMWEKEYRFHPKRKWRFDYAWSAYKIAVEIEGGSWVGGRHNRGAGFAKDCEKYNAATAAGWRVFRLTGSMITLENVQPIIDLIGVEVLQDYLLEGVTNERGP
jgi:very-short-patch-repair endonuclease